MRLAIGALLVVGSLAHGLALDDAKQNIINFHVVTPAADNSPLIMRGSRLGIDLKHPRKLNEELLRRDLQTLKDLGVRTIINLQGGDLQAHVRVGMSDGTINQALSDAVSLAIDAVNDVREPGETEAHLEAEVAIAGTLGLAVERHSINSVNPIDESKAESIKGALRTMNASLRTMNGPDKHGVYVHCEHGHDRTGMVIALYKVCLLGVDPEVAYQDMLDNGHNPDDHVTESTDIFFWRSVASKTFCQSVKN